LVFVRSFGILCRRREDRRHDARHRFASFLVGFPRLLYGVAARSVATLSAWFPASCLVAFLGLYALCTDSWVVVAKIDVATSM
jgi:hypothetical protein